MHTHIDLYMSYVKVTPLNNLTWDWCFVNPPWDHVFYHALSIHHEIMCSIHAYHACHILHRLDLMCCHVCNMFGNVLPLNYWRNYVLGVKKKKKIQRTQFNQIWKCILQVRPHKWQQSQNLIKYCIATLPLKWQRYYTCPTWLK